MPNVIEPLFALIRLRKLVVNAVIPLGRFDEIVFEEITSTDLEQRLGALRALGKIVDQGQVVSTRFGETAVELVNGGAALRPRSGRFPWPRQSYQARRRRAAKRRPTSRLRAGRRKSASPPSSASSRVAPRRSRPARRDRVGAAIAACQSRPGTGRS